MEGPSLFLAAELLAPFIGQEVLQVEGNTKIGKERLLNKKVMTLFSWGKHLVLQFDTFALRTHFLLYGTFEATIDQKRVTGDYTRKTVTPRLELKFLNGELKLFNCSLRYLEGSDAKALYDFSIDVMSPFWNPEKALNRVGMEEEKEIGDVLLDQTIFAGVGNIIKNETLFLVGLSPERKVKDISPEKRAEIVSVAQSYSQQFYKWRKKFVLKKHYKVYRRSHCPTCGGTVTRKKTGLSKRISFYCEKCQY